MRLRFLENKILQNNLSNGFFTCKRFESLILRFSRLSLREVELIGNSSVCLDIYVNLRILQNIDIYFI
jgi:hypothetical protein